MSKAGGLNDIRGYIDIHSHILPGVDDGSGSMDETVRMLKLAYEQGIRTIIATPHYATGADNVTATQLNKIRDEVQTRADEIGDGIKLLLGNELYFSRSVIDKLRSGEALTLAGSRYVLVEFSPREHFNQIYQGLSDLIRAGFLPILAHVERYRCLFKKEYRISDLIELGCCIQMNASSPLGGLLNSDARYNRKLIEQGLVHFIGSDCHDDTVRVPCMKMTEKILQKRCNERQLEKLFYMNPLRVLENTYI